MQMRSVGLWEHLLDTALPSWITTSDPEALYLTGSYLCLDFEAFGPDKASPLADESDLALACWQVWRDGECIKKAHIAGGIYEMGALLEDIRQVDFIVCAFAKYELQWLKRCGAELRDILAYDVVLAEWVLDGNKKQERSLAALAKRYGLPGKVDLISTLIRAGVDVRDIHPQWLLDYCHQDVEATLRVFQAQKAVVSVRAVWHLVHVRNMTCSVLADIEFAGLYLDPERVQVEYLKAIEIRDRIGAELASLTGGINLNSSKQLATYLYDVLGFDEATDYKGRPLRTGKDARSANAKILALLKPRTAEQTHFLSRYKEYNKQVSLLEKNLDYFKRTCGEKECKFYGSLQQNVVQTHRLSSNGRPILFKGLKKSKSVQLQNMPREFKKLICSNDSDYVVMGNDSAQIEFRVAVDLGHDRIGLQEIVTGFDVHANSARVMTEAGEPTSRQDAKPVTFRPLFGGGSGSPALVAYCEYFKEHYEGISSTQRGWALKCVDKKQFTTPYNMTFYFPNCKMNRNGYISDSTSIYNYPIQNFATGEIMPIALIFFWHRTRNLRVQIFNTVHDEIVSRVHVDDVLAAKEMAKQAMSYDIYSFLTRVYHYTLKVPLGFGTKVGTHWGEGEEEKWDIFQDGTEVRR
jgi:DNA polymerase I-like protein with 3'-5' exonuclease and polymerase domains